MSLRCGSKTGYFGKKWKKFITGIKTLTSIPGAMFKGPDLDSVAVEEPSYTFESQNGSLPPPPPYDPNEVEVQLLSTAVHDENPPPY